MAERGVRAHPQDEAPDLRYLVAVCVAACIKPCYNEALVEIAEFERLRCVFRVTLGRGMWDANFVPSSAIAARLHRDT